MMFRRLKRKIALSLCLGVIVFIAISLHFDYHRIIVAFQAFHWIYLPLILLFSVFNYALRFFKWDFYLSKLDVLLPKMDSLSVFMAGLLMSVTPGKIGEVLKAHLVKRLNGTPMSVTAPIIVAERLTDFISLLIISSVGVFAFQYGARVLIISSALTLILLVAVGSRRIALPLIAIFERIPIISRMGGKMKVAYESTYIMVTFRNLLWPIVLSVAAWSCECFGLYLTLIAFDVLPSTLGTFFIYAFSTLIGAITMLPGGIGTTEGSMACLLIVLLSLPRHIAAASTLIIRICTLWFAVALGAIVLLLNRNTFVSDRELESIEQT